MQPTQVMLPLCKSAVHALKQECPQGVIYFCRWTSWDADDTGAVTHAASVEDVMQQLRALPAQEVRRLQRMGALVRSVFQYRRSPGATNVAGQEVAGDLIVQAICKRAQREVTVRAGHIIAAGSSLQAW